MSISYTEFSLPAQRFYLVHSIFPNQAAHDRAHKYDAYRFGKKASYQGFGSKEENSGCMCGVVGVRVILCPMIEYGFMRVTNEYRFDTWNNSLRLRVVMPNSFRHLT
jgi:hypothetical protein